MRELEPGLWHWEALHPQWEGSLERGRQVSSYAIDDGELLLLFDPIAVPGEIERLAAAREAVVVLTAPWHERDTRSLVERLGVPVFAPRPETEDDLMEKYGLTREQAAGGSPDLRWLVAGEAGEGHFFAAGDPLPAGIRAFGRPGREATEVVLWVESRRSVVAGDTLVDFGDGVELNLRWLDEGVTPEQVVEGLRPLLSLPVERVLLTHGGPFDRAALERALAR